LLESQKTTIAVRRTEGNNNAGHPPAYVMGVTTLPGGSTLWRQKDNADTARSCSHHSASRITQYRPYLRN
jgi:hypothetical protein